MFTVIEFQFISVILLCLCYCYDICVILGRRRSRVYNVVTVQCMISIILNIQGQTWCSVGRNPKNAIGSSLFGVETTERFVQISATRPRYIFQN